MLNEQLQRIVFGILTTFLAGFGGCLSTGCAMLDPGGQVRRGLEQRTLKEWRADGGFWAEGVGTQTESYTMAQGRLVLNEDGTINTEESVIEYYLKADPSADVAGTAMGQALMASTEQAKAMAAAIESLSSLVVPLLAPASGMLNTESSREPD